MDFFAIVVLFVVFFSSVGFSFLESFLARFFVSFVSHTTVVVWNVKFTNSRTGWSYRCRNGRRTSAYLSYGLVCPFVMVFFPLNVDFEAFASLHSDPYLVKLFCGRSFVSFGDLLVGGQWLSLWLFVKLSCLFTLRFRSIASHDGLVTSVAHFASYVVEVPMRRWLIAHACVCFDAFMSSWRSIGVMRCLLFEAILDPIQRQF